MDKPVQLTKDAIRKALLEHRDTLNKYGVKRLGLFGSYAKGTAREDSDIDLLVELKRTSFDDYMGLRIFLEDLFEKKIDLITARSVKPRLKPRIEKEVEYIADLRTYAFGSWLCDSSHLPDAPCGVSTVLLTKALLRTPVS